MKHGIKIPKDERPAMAMRALAIYEATGNLVDVEFEFDVSNPTARNLVSFGRFLRALVDA